MMCDQKILDLSAAYAAYLREALGIYRWRELAHAIVPTNMLQFIEGSKVSQEAAQITIDYFKKEENPVQSQNEERLVYGLSEIRLMASVPRLVSIRDCSAFLQHSKNGPLGLNLPAIFYKIPRHYRTSHTDIVGPDAPILWPSYSKKLDYELEFAVCIGKRGINIPIEKAEEYIFGYIIFNDISARDKQDKELPLGLGPAKGKCFQNSNIMGPCLVTPDEIDANNLRMVARINGELWSEGNSRDMYFKFPQLIAYISEEDYLYPGECISSGTVGGGCGGELKKWIKPGNTIELEVEGIGILKNTVEKKK